MLPPEGLTPFSCASESGVLTTKGRADWFAESTKQGSWLGLWYTGSMRVKNMKQGDSIARFCRLGMSSAGCATICPTADACKMRGCSCALGGVRGVFTQSQ